VAGNAHLSRAYELARRFRTTHPNPRVGAVVVSAEGEVIGEGAHVGPGEPHAEVVALERAGNATGATVYVSLEPCSHQGRTPPCVDRLIEKGVARVVVGTIDPDLNVNGSGVLGLEEAGIEVEVVDDAEARSVDPGYFHHRETGMPLVVLKWAMTLDGSVAAQDGSSRWITSAPARAEAHRLRAEVDAVVVGAGTLRSDDPLLDVRLEGFEGPQPRAVLIAGNEALPDEARIWEREPIVVSAHERSIPSGDLVVVAGEAGRPDPVAVCARLADLGHLDLLVEGGPTLAGAWWRAGAVDKGIVHIGGKVGGGTGRSPLDGLFATITDASDVELDAVRSVSDDVIVTFRRRV
jgi:diaminohydroxyphosphoribosylaminopyrimidine deaminase/5-amino-6-(5-phosphoribosylamino)uracil reductase